MKGTSRTLLVLTILSLCWITVARADDFNRKIYVDSVISILRAHANAIENLSTHHIKYSDNIVRHAVALQQTFGLMGPMDWHAAQSAKLMVNKDPKRIAEDQKKFELLEKRSDFAMKALVLAAHNALENDNREGLKEALQNVKNSCNECHSYLPASVAPDVWGTLVRK
jgi:cytochrome c556